MSDKSACGDAGPEAHHQHRAWLLCEEGRHVAQNPLEPHVLRLSGSHDLASHVDVPVPVAQFCYGYGRVDALAHVQC